MKEYIKFWKYLGNCNFKYTKSLKSLNYIIEDLYTNDYVLPNKLTVLYGTNDFNDKRLLEYIKSNYIIGLLPVYNYEKQINNNDNWHYFMPEPYYITVYDKINFK